MTAKLAPEDAHVNKERRYWDEEAELRLNTPLMRQIQLDKLRPQLARLHATKSFWRERMDAVGLNPVRLGSLEEYSAKMPIMDKALRRQLVLECGGDSMQMVERTIGVAMDRVSLMAATSGTTGEPTPYPLTRKDLEIMGEMFARMAWRIGIRPGSRIAHAFGLSMWLAGVPYVQFLQKVGATVLPIGAEGGSERLLRFIKQFRADTLFGTPSLVEHLIDKAPEVIGADVGSLGIRRIVCAGEPGAGIPAVREKIERAYGATLHDHGGGLGISCACAEYQGMHHIGDDYVLMELVDPDTLRPIPITHGARGMPVYTTLEHEGMLWVRETFGDIFEVLTEPCQCGCSGFRYKVIGRVDDMLKVKGVMVYPAAIDGVITSFAPRVTGEFRIVLTEKPPRVVPPLQLRVEYGRDVDPSTLDALAREIEQTMNAKLKISPKIVWVPPFSLERSSGKTKFFEREYAQ